MSEAELGDRIDGVRQLGGVVRAMTGIAGARARTARAQSAAVAAYTAVLDDALRQAKAGGCETEAPAVARPALVVFGAEQGFVGGFSERVMAVAAEHAAGSDLYLIGARAQGVAAGLGMAPVWSASMPSRSAGLPKFADRVLEAVFAGGEARALSVIHAISERGKERVERRELFPLQVSDGTTPRAAPLANLPAPELAAALALDRLHALMTEAALVAFIAENEARMVAMSAASRQIEEELASLEALARRARQEGITAEIIEIAAGAMAAR